MDGGGSCIRILDNLDKKAPKLKRAVFLLNLRPTDQAFLEVGLKPCLQEVVWPESAHINVVSNSKETKPLRLQVQKYHNYPD